MLVLLVFFLEIGMLFFLSRALTEILSSVLLRISRSQTTTIQLLSFLFLPGVIIHELSHLLVAGVLFVPVGEIEFFPKVTEGGVKLGSVAIGKTDPLRRAAVGLAPILVGIMLLLGFASFYFSYAYETFSLPTLLLFYGSFQIGNTMFSSAKDIEGLLEVLFVFGFFALAFYIFTLLSGFHLTLSSFPLAQIGGVIRPLVKVLGIIILLDVMSIGILRVVQRR